MNKKTIYANTIIVRSSFTNQYMIVKLMRPMNNFSTIAHVIDSYVIYDEDIPKNIHFIK